MEFLNLGWLEIALILVLAFIVLGPENGENWPRPGKLDPKNEP